MSAACSMQQINQIVPSQIQVVTYCQPQMNESMGMHFDDQIRVRNIRTSFTCFHVITKIPITQYIYIYIYI